MRHLTILSQFQEISARTGIPVGQLMEARERAAELLLEVSEERIERARLDWEIAAAVTRRSLRQPVESTP
jgi:hypothetical protein